MATTITTKAVLTINGKQVENTFQNVSREARSLERDLKKLTAGSKEYNEKWAELKKANQFLDEHKKKLAETKKVAQESGTSISGFFEDSTTHAKQLFSDILSGQMSFKSLGSTIKIFATESWAAISSVPVIGWVAAIAGAVGLGIKEVMDYNNAISENIKKLDNLGVDQKVRPQIEAISEYFKLSFDQISNAVDQMLDLGIVKDAAQAIEEIKRGLVKAPDKSAFISSIEETAETAKKLGMNLSNIIIIKEEIENRGLDGEKTFGSLSTAVNRILGNAEKLQPVLSSIFGKSFADELYKGVINGTLDYGEALNLIYKKGEEIGLSDKERADIAKNLFGKSSASAYDYNNTLELISESYRDNYDELSKIQEKTAHQISLFEELAIEKDKALNSSSLRAFQKDMKEFWLQLQIAFFKFLNSLDDLYVKIKFTQGYLRGMFLAIPEAAKAVFTQTIKTFDSFLQTMESGGKSVWAFLSGDLDKANAEFSKFRNNAKGFAQDLLKIHTIPLTTSLTAGTKEGTKQMNNYIAAQNKKAKLAREEEEAEAKRNAKKNRESQDTGFGNKNPKKQSPSKNNNSEEDLNKELESAKESYNKATADILRAENKLADEKFKIRKDSLEKDIDLQNQSYKEELDRLEQDNQGILDKIIDLEQKKLKAKNPLAKAEFQKAIDKENELLKINNSIKEQIEQTHQLKLKTIREKWDAKNFEDVVKQAEKDFTELEKQNKKELDSIKTLGEAKAKILKDFGDEYSENEVKNINTLEEAKKIIEEKSNQKLIDSQVKFLSSIKTKLKELVKLFSPESEEFKKFNEYIETLSGKIDDLSNSKDPKRKKGGGKKVEDWTDAEKAAMQADVLGFTAQQWFETFNNLDTTTGKLQAIGMVFKSLSNAGQMFADLQRSLGERDLKNFERLQERKKQALTKQLNEGYITNEEYNKRIEKLEKQTANKKAELEYKQAKADKISRMFAVVGNTALAITSALAAPFPISTYLLWIVGALGAVQLATVAAQPLPEKPSYATGGFTGSGYGMPDESGYKPAGIVHEREYVIPEVMTSNPRYANVISWLENERLGRNKVTSFAEGGSVTETASASNSTVSTAMITGEYNADIKVFLAKNIELLEYLIENGVHIEESMQNAKKLEKMQKEWNELTSKNKY